MAAGSVQGDPHNGFAGTPASTAKKRPRSSASKPEEEQIHMYILISNGNADFYLLIWSTDGRKCKVCGMGDNSPDPIDARFPGRRWPYAVKRFRDKNRGDCCWYCVKIFDSRYRHMKVVPSIEGLPEHLAKSTENRQKFEGYLEHMIKHIKNCLDFGSVSGARASW